MTIHLRTISNDRWSRIQQVYYFIHIHIKIYNKGLLLGKHPVCFSYVAQINHTFAKAFHNLCMHHLLSLDPLLCFFQLLKVHKLNL